MEVPEVSYYRDMAELLSGVKIQLKDGSQVDAGDYLKGKVSYCIFILFLIWNSS